MYFQVIINSFSGLGPYCLCFKENEPCTVYNLKEKLAKTTAISIEEQRIRSLGGRILTDSDDLFKDYSIKDGPIILNLTVCLIGGRMDQSKVKPCMKKVRLNNETVNIPSIKNDQQQQQQHKGKQQESRKRKHV